MYGQNWFYLALLLIGGAFAAFSLKEVISGRHTHARIQKQGGSPFLGQYPMDFAYWVLTPIGKLAANIKISPDVFSWSCLVLGTIAGSAAAVGKISLAGGLSLIAASLDALDGMVARSQGIASDAGEILDAAVDRYTEFALLAGLAIYYRFEPWAMLLVLLALLGSFMVSYSQAKGETMNIEVPKGWMRRPERAVYLGGGAFLSPAITRWFELGQVPSLHYPLLFSVMLVGIFGNATAIHRFFVMIEILRERDRTQKKGRSSIRQ